MKHFAPERDTSIFVSILLLFVGGGLFDLLVLDQPIEWNSFHVLFEAGVLVLGLALLVNLGLARMRSHKQIEELSAAVSAHADERDRWRSSARSALASMAEAIDRQFDEWQLTPAERDVALLLLKGYSHKAIAGQSERSAQTVRTHAAAVYTKAGLSGRAQLSAFFLEDIALPSSAGVKGET